MLKRSLLIGFFLFNSGCFLFVRAVAEDVCYDNCAKHHKVTGSFEDEACLEQCGQEVPGRPVSNQPGY